MAVSLTVNGDERSLNIEGDTPLLWVLRDELGLKGTKFGCGAGLCGACTVHLNGQPVRSCSTPVEMAAGGDVVTIEGLGEGSRLHALQDAWIEHGVPQCGYCISGQIMATSALLSQNLEADDEEIENKISNLCRCGNYVRVRKAIRRSAELIQQQEA